MRGRRCAVSHCRLLSQARCPPRPQSVERGKRHVKYCTGTIIKRASTRIECRCMTENRMCCTGTISSEGKQATPATPSDADDDDDIDDNNDVAATASSGGGVRVLPPRGEGAKRPINELEDAIGAHEGAFTEQTALVAKLKDTISQKVWPVVSSAHQPRLSRSRPGLNARTVGDVIGDAPLPPGMDYCTPLLDPDASIAAGYGVFDA